MTWKAKNFEESMTPFIDEIYKSIFKSKLDNVFRSNTENGDARTLFMDKELAIDTHLTFKDGEVLTFQEKTRRCKYSKFNDFTFEYYNDPRTKEEGEWFKLAAQYYFYGYANANENGYSKYWIIDIARLRTGIMRRFTIQELENNYLRNNPPPAKANFFTIPFGILEELNGVVVYKSNEL